MAALAALGAHVDAASLTESVAGNVALLGFSLVGLLAAAALVGTAKEIRAERADPLNERHYINF
jgi:hypothetical protein